MGDKSVKNRTWSGAKGLAEVAKKSLEKKFIKMQSLYQELWAVT